MRFILCEDYDELSLVSAKTVQEKIKQKPNAILGLATGSTPVGMYQNLVKMHQEGELDFSHVSSYNLDEYYPLSPKDPNSYRYFMNENLFNHINIDISQTHVPNGTADDPNAECNRYEQLLAESEGVDIQILGIGENGHIGFNEPADTLIASTHLTDLTPSTISANARFFATPDDVPTKALTMGMGSIMRAKTILLLISGAKKHTVLQALLNDGITTSVPATLLKLHPDVAVICDKAAYYGA